MTTTTTLVFVYGTLKRGYGNNRLLQNAEFLGEAISGEGNYVMQDVGFPTLWRVVVPPVRHQLMGRVAGEIFRVTSEELAGLDRLEANGRMYTREQRGFMITGERASSMDEKNGATAWIYLWNRERDNRPIEPVDGVLVWDREGKRKLRGAG
jgi:gamma-glutamylaminecyclotransferase